MLNIFSVYLSVKSKAKSKRFSLLTHRHTQKIRYGTLYVHEFELKTGVCLIDAILVEASNRCDNIVIRTTSLQWNNFVYRRKQ